MAFMEPGIFILTLFAFHVSAQVEMCYVQYVDSTNASVRWCYSRSQYTNYTVDVRPVGPVVDAYDGPQKVFGCETELRNLCPDQEYEVTVKSGPEEKSCNFTTYQGDVDNMLPSELQVAELTSTSAKVIWKHARCFRRDRTMYYLLRIVNQVYPTHWWTDEYRAWGADSLNETHDQYEKTGMVPGRRYRYHFNTCTRYDCSRSQLDKLITTPHANDPSRPRMLKVQSIKTDSFQISWSEPDGPVEGYMVYIDDEPYPKFTSNTSWKADNLDPDTDYVVSVVAYNMDGETRLCSENVTVVIRTSPEALDPPRNLTLVDVGTTTFDIVWDLPSNTSSSTYVTGHRVTVNSDVYWLGGDRNWFHDYSLRPNTQYKVEVTALSGNVMSGPAQTIVWTKERRYNPPRNLTVMYMDSSYFEVSWLPPHHNGNEKLTAYEVYVNDVPVASQPRWITTFRKDNLNSTQQPSEYTVKVYARYESWDSLSDPVSTVIGISKKCTAGGSSSWKQFFAAKFSFFSFSQVPNAESDDD